jgi:uncharacterized protein (DUF983 family)
MKISMREIKARILKQKGMKKGNNLICPQCGSGNVIYPSVICTSCGEEGITGKKKV